MARRIGLSDKDRASLAVVSNMAVARRRLADAAREGIGGHCGAALRALLEAQEASSVARILSTPAGGPVYGDALRLEQSVTGPGAAVFEQHCLRRSPY